MAEGLLQDNHSGLYPARSRIYISESVDCEIWISVTITMIESLSLKREHLSSPGIDPNPASSSLRDHVEILRTPAQMVIHNDIVACTTPSPSVYQCISQV